MSLTDLLMRPYWRRAWILQEVALARQAVFHCGKYRLNSKHLPDYVQLVASVSSGMDSLPPHNERSAAICSRLYGAIENHDALSMMLYRKRKGHLHWPTVTDLTAMTAQLASVQHDHIYAILGTLEPTLAQRVVPNYAMNVSDVFQEFAFGYMDFMKSASLLTRSICLRPSSFHLPSWVPDFSTRQLDILEASAFASARFHENDQFEPKFCMTKKGLLGINAFCMDLIIDSRPVEVNDETLSDLGVDTDKALEHHSVCREFFQLRELGESSYVGGGKAEEAYWRTLCFDRYDESEYPAYSGGPWLLQKHVAACSSWYASRNVNLPREDEHIAKHFNRNLVLLRKNHLFRTAKGYFGMTDLDCAAEIGDNFF